MKGIWQKLVAEGIGTFGLVFVGTGAMILNDFAGGALTDGGVSLVFGLIVALLILVLGDVSGAHFNPSVTLGFFVSGRVPFREVIPYMASQIAGALCASGTLRMLAPRHETLGATLPAWGVWPAFIAEIVLTGFLVFAILAVVSVPRMRGWPVALVIGAVIAFEAFFGGPISGASMNPARSVGPALASVHWEGLWIYVIAPLLGALAGVAACSLARGAGCCRGHRSGAHLRDRDSGRASVG
jgi:aquaporin Z